MLKMKLVLSELEVKLRLLGMLVLSSIFYNLWCLFGLLIVVLFRICFFSWFH